MGGNQKSSSKPSAGSTESMETRRHHVHETSPLINAVVGLACMTSVGLLVIGHVLSFMTPSSLKAEQTTRPQRFCCEDEAVQVASLLNASSDVCGDFYSYVCSTHENPSSKYMSPVTHMFMKLRLAQILRLSSIRSDAGDLLAALRSGLSEKQAPIGTAPVTIVSMTSAITAWAKTVLSVTDVPVMISFFAEASFRYRLPSVVAFELSSTGSDGAPSTLCLVRNTVCDRILASRNLAAAAVVQAFNEFWNTKVEVEDIVKFSQALYKMRIQGETGNLTKILTDSPFPVLSNDTWNEIVSEFVSPVYSNVNTVRHAKGDRLNDVLGVLANARNQQVSVAYIVTCTALNAYKEMATVMNKSRSRELLPSCEELAVCELEEVFQSEAISTQKADYYVRDFFSHVVNHVTARVEASSTPGLFSSSDKNSAVRYLKEMKVMLPKEIAVADLRVPDFNASHSFFENLLLARSHSFELRKARAAAGIPSRHHLFRPEVVRRDSVVFVPSNLYMLLKTNGSSSSPMNIPAIGIAMAMEVWSFLLEKITWSEETLANIQARRKCFRGTQRENQSEEYDRIWLKALSLSLGFTSVVDPQRQQGWRNIHTVGRMTFTEGQLYYLLWMNSHCDSIIRFLPKEDINRALRNSPTFLDAFQCHDGAMPLTNSTCLHL